MKTLYLFVILILHKYFLTTDAYLNYHSRMDRDDQFGYESDDTFEDAPAHEEKRSTDNEPIDEYEANDVAKRNSLYGRLSLLNFSTHLFFNIFIFKGDISKLTDLKSLSDEDISLALSKLSSNELETLDKFIEAESDRADNELRKREVDNNKKDEDDDDYDEISNESNEKPNEKKRCDQNDYGKEIRYNAHDFDDEDEAGQLLNIFNSQNSLIIIFIVKKIDKRKISVPLRRGRIQRLTPEQRIEAKLNFLRDKYKRQSQCE